jgi:hypothetical protein
MATDRSAAAPEDVLPASSPLRTPRAAAAAGLVFSVFTIASMLLIRLASPDDAAQAGDWLSNSAKRTAVNIGLNLVPFAGIAFIWFVGVIRDRVGAREDRFFATVFMGSGLLFVGMFFVAAALAGGLIGSATAHPESLPGSDTLSLGRNTSTILLNVYAMRMAAVFTLTTVTIARQTKIVPAWLWVAGLATALVLLVVVNFTPWVELLFPLWILALSLDILLHPLPAAPG